MNNLKDRILLTDIMIQLEKLAVDKSEYWGSVWKGTLEEIVRFIHEGSEILVTY